MNVGPSQPTVIADEQLIAAPKNSVVLKQQASGEEFQTSRYRVLDEFRYPNAGLSPLTPLAVEIDARPWRRSPQDFVPVPSNDAATTPEPMVGDQPKSAPELMREMLNGIASLPSSRN
jgi:hypothetical protein